MLYHFPISSPPRRPGVYLLRNEKAKICYVGQAIDLSRRWTEWKSVFASNLGIKSKVVYKVVKETPIEDWEFVVLCDTKDADRLDELELAALKLARASGWRVLNYENPRPLA